MCSNIQDIFDTVMEIGFYNPRRMGSSTSSRYMCVALSIAADEHEITYGEQIAAGDAIDNYLRFEHSLLSALKLRGLPHAPEDLLAVYQDWANRPELTP